jgi:hypothetical protein
VVNVVTMVPYSVDNSNQHHSGVYASESRAS